MLAETIDTYSQKEWWSKRLPHFKKNFEPDSELDFKKFISDRQTKILNREKDNLLLNTFHEFETKIRNIIRVLSNVPNTENSKKCLRGTEKFYTIRKSFVESYLELELEDSNLIQLLQEIRNSIHNSGIFYPFNQQDKEITYKEVTYKFSNSYPINFIDWEFTTFIIADLVKLIRKILTHNLIVGVDEIIDPVTKITWKE